MAVSLSGAGVSWRRGECIDSPSWRDQLTTVNGVPISYDAIGNPLNDGTWTYTWQNGRQLAGMSKDGTTVSFKYNASGLHTRKIVNGVVTNYTLHGKNVVHMTKGNDSLHFFYDAQNRPAVVVYNGTAYAYVKNLQGDIIAILDSTGAAVVSYNYDAWGAPTSATGTMAATLGVLNPFRYRGYVYDEEIGLYYLRSRYYNPDLFRFVNADVLYNYNLMTYAANNPLYYCDKDGYALCRLFEGCGFGNPFASLTGGVTIGGGSCGGFASGLEAYSAAGAISILSDDHGRSESVGKVVDTISLTIGIPVIAFASTAIATTVSIGFARLAEAFAIEALTLELGKDIAYGIKAITILCGTCIGHAAQSAFNEAFFAREPEPLDCTKESISAVFSAIDPIQVPPVVEYAIDTMKAIFTDDSLPPK